MSDKTTSVYLTDEELQVLDGFCREEIQKVVDKAIERLSLKSDLQDIPEKYQEFIAQAIQCAQDNGKLTYQRAELSVCPLCGTSKTYAT